MSETRTASFIPKSLFTEGFLNDPYPIYRRFLAEGPVHYLELGSRGGWVSQLLRLLNRCSRCETFRNGYRFGGCLRYAALRIRQVSGRFAKENT